MPNVTLTIDGDTVMDIDIATWTAQPPAVADLQLRARKDPWAIPALQAIADAAITQRDTRITVQTATTGWAMDVQWPG